MTNVRSCLFLGALLAMIGHAAVAQDQGADAATLSVEGEAQDLRGPYAEALRAAGAELHGWWGVLSDGKSPASSATFPTEANAPDAARNAISINFSRMQDPDDPEAAALMALCSLGEIYLAYVPRRMSQDAEPARETAAVDDGATDASQWIAARRAGELRLVSLGLDGVAPMVEDWVTLQNHTGVFLHGDRAEAVLEISTTVATLSLLLSTSDGTISSTFEMEGAGAAVAAVKTACADASEPAQTE